MANPKLTLVDDDDRNASDKPPRKAGTKSKKAATKRTSRKIEKNVPIPARRGGKPGRILYPEMYALKKGESVLIEGVTRAGLSGSIAHLRKTRGGLYVTRAADGGIRIWRVK